MNVCTAFGACECCKPKPIRWWQIGRRLRLWWVRFQMWRSHRRMLKHGLKFPVIKNAKPTLSLDDVVSAEPQFGAQGTENHIPWEYKTDE